MWGGAQVFRAHGAADGPAVADRQALLSGGRVRAAVSGGTASAGRQAGAGGPANVGSGYCCGVRRRVVARAWSATIGST